MIDRLVSVGNVIVDVVATVDELPARGGDVFASSSSLEVGGGFNLIASARRQGLPVAYAGALGTGPLADLCRAALARVGATVELPPVPGLDTGFAIALVDSGAERTFVTGLGAEAQLTDEALSRVAIGPSDCVVVSGYGLLHPSNAHAITALLSRVDAAATVVYDPGPLGHTVAAEVLTAVLTRADWVSCNEREAELLPAVSRGLVIRLGDRGCTVTVDGVSEHIDGFPVVAVDSNGAGDAHVGTFVAGLARGLSPREACRRANAAAALTVTRCGPASSPSAAEVDGLMSTGHSRS